MTPELNLLVLRAADVAALLRFYAALGIEFNKEQHGSGPEHYSGKAGGVVLEIYPIGSAPATTSARLGFTVSSLSTSIAAAVAAGGSIVSPPHDSIWGSRAVLADPEGNRVELLQRSIEGEATCQLRLRPRNEIPGGLWSWSVYVDGNRHARGPGSTRKDPLPWYASLLPGPHRIVIREQQVGAPNRIESNTLHFMVGGQSEIIVDVWYNDGAIFLELSAAEP